MERDLAKAKEWFEIAASNGNVVAQYNLAVFYHKGIGVTKDDKQALYWMELSAKNGYASSQSFLGFWYAMGEIVPKDLKKIQTLAGRGCHAKRGRCYAGT